MNGAGVGNEINGSVTGSVVQAGTIGQVVVSAPSPEALPIPRQLPPALRDFAGRSAELAALDSLQSGGYPVCGAAVVTGTAGVGKTTLVVLWACRAQQWFPDGTLFVNLRGYGPSEPLASALVLAGFLSALGIADERMPSDSDALAGLYRSVLAGRRVLIVLDNAGSADQVRPLLPGAMGCLVLVTSRAALAGLAVEGARRITLDLLPLAEARALVHKVIGEHRAEAEPDAVGELIRVCARLPLALRIALTRLAARRRLGVADVVEDIVEEQSRVDALSSNGDESASVRGVFDWSYTRLPEEQARTFRLLGLHPGPEFGVHAVAALTGLDLPTVYRHLEALADMHLVEPVVRKRYRLHDLLYAYAAGQAERDDSEGDRREAVGRVLTWYAHTALTADRLVFPGLPSIEPSIDDLVGLVGGELVFTNRGRALGWLNAERPNLMAALRTAVDCHAYGPALCLAGTGRFLLLGERVMWPVRVEAASLGIAAARACKNRSAEAFLLVSRGETLTKLDRWAEAETDCVRVLNLGRELNDLERQAGALNGLGLIRRQQGRCLEARDYYLEALPLSRHLEGRRWEAVLEGNLSEVSVLLGHHEQALEHAYGELELRRQVGDQMGEAYALYHVAAAWHESGDDLAGLEFAEQALALNRTLDGAEHFTAIMLETAASCLEGLGELSRAAEYVCEACTIVTEFGDPRAECLRERLRDLESCSGAPAGEDVH